MSKKPLHFSADQRANLDRWATLLETTALPQAREYLHTPAGWCCLGLWLEERQHPAWLAVTHPYLQTPDMDYLSLPLTESDALGLDQGAFLPRNASMMGLQTLATLLNDKARWSFPRIAQEIRHWLEHGCLSDEVVTVLGLD